MVSQCGFGLVPLLLSVGFFDEAVAYLAMRNDVMIIYQSAMTTTKYRTGSASSESFNTWRWQMRELGDRDLSRSY